MGAADVALRRVASRDALPPAAQGEDSAAAGGKAEVHTDAKAEVNTLREPIGLAVRGPASRCQAPARGPSQNLGAEDLEVQRSGSATRAAPDGPRKGLLGFAGVLASSKVLSALLLCIPLGFLSNFQGWPMWAVFACNFFAVLPMAWLIGKSTEDLAAHTGEAAGGLLNATFGNVVEMLLCVQGIRRGEMAIVRYTLVGSILSNMLLVLGTALLWGGYKNPPPKTMKYSRTGAGAQGNLMLISVLGVALPTVYSMLSEGTGAVLDISRGCSVMLFSLYVQYLFFQLKTHKHVFEGPEGEHGEVECPDMDAYTAVAVLAACTALTSCCADYLIGSIEGTIASCSVSREFVGVVVLPIIGNAAEHFTAILVAGQNRMDLSLGVAVGSSCQVALMVTPFTVFVGWAVGSPMSLDFGPFQVAVLLMAVLLVTSVLKDGESTWLDGSMLCTAYCAIALMCFFGFSP
uniref:Sodium/calcium exchanger membrane region domain-containing protein n=1 Tax=Zooxanthella nutricula TaxID=1333877 RepID=A0A7S2NT36_9DINO